MWFRRSDSLHAVKVSSSPHFGSALNSNYSFQRLWTQRWFTVSRLTPSIQTARRAVWFEPPSDRDVKAWKCKRKCHHTQSHYTQLRNSGQDLRESRLPARFNNARLQKFMSYRLGYGLPGSRRPWCRSLESITKVNLVKTRTGQNHPFNLSFL
jgi:hypothetical protein